MLIGRRAVLLVMPVAVAVTPFAPAILSCSRRVTQDELDRAIRDHAAWLRREGGARAVFAECDLSGLSLRSDDGELIDLRSADFTEADLSGASGGLVSFAYASLFGARLSGSHFVEPGFIGANLQHAICDRVAWGTSPALGNVPSFVNADGAVFHHTNLMHSDFSKGRIRGHFVGACFSGATLVGTDFSFSDFSSSDDETSFFGADLTGASFTDTHLTAARFARARLDGTKLKGAQFGKRTVQNLSRMRRIDILKGGCDDQLS